MKINSEVKLEKFFTKNEIVIKNPKINGKTITYTKEIKGLNKILAIIWYSIICNKKACHLAKNGGKTITLKCKKIDIGALHLVYDTFFLIKDVERLPQKWAQIKEECIQLENAKEIQQKLQPLMDFCHNQLFDKGDGKVISVLKEVMQLYYNYTPSDFQKYYPAILKKGVELKAPKAIYDCAILKSLDSQAEELQGFEERKLYQDLGKLIESGAEKGIFSDHEYYVIYRKLEPLQKCESTAKKYRVKAEVHLKACLDYLNKELILIQKNTDNIPLLIIKLVEFKDQLEEMLICGDRKDVLDILSNVCVGLQMSGSFSEKDLALVIMRSMGCEQ